jgi:hypothetical protein
MKNNKTNCGKQSGFFTSPQPHFTRRAAEFEKASLFGSLPPPSLPDQL